MVNYVEEDYEQTYQKGLEIAEKIMKKGPIAIRAAKKAINKG